MWSSSTGAVTSSTVAPFAKCCFSLTREAFEKEVRSCHSLLPCLVEDSKRVLPSLLSTEVGLAVAHYSHPRIPEKGQPNVQAAGKKDAEW